MFPLLFLSTWIIFHLHSFLHAVDHNQVEHLIPLVYHVGNALAPMIFLCFWHPFNILAFFFNTSLGTSLIAWAHHSAGGQKVDRALVRLKVMVLLLFFSRLVRLNGEQFIFTEPRLV